MKKNKLGYWIIGIVLIYLFTPGTIETILGLSVLAFLIWMSNN